MGHSTVDDLTDAEAATIGRYLRGRLHEGYLISGFPDCLSAGPDGQIEGRLMLVRLEDLQQKLAEAGVHVRRCHDCGGLQFSADATIPYCTCRKCGTADTRRVKQAEQLEWPWCAGLGAKT